MENASTRPLSNPPHDLPHTALWTNPRREALFQHWLTGIQAEHQLDAASVRLASADASFRRYLRVDSANGTLVIMDAPPDKEDCKPFAKVAELMTAAGLKAPKVLAWDEPNGFMLLTDLGMQTMMQVMDPAAPAPLPLYLEAADTVVQWQLASREGVLPPYDRALLLRELELFPEWYIRQHRGISINAAQRKTLDDAFACIVDNNLSWPSVYVHRDFMPRNLMVDAGGVSQVHTNKLGVLDFQDAVYGPITYDIASLMRDAFLSWDESFCLDVTIRYWEKARKAKLPVGDDFGEFYRAVEWMGLQRHLKVAGIFARLTLRDGKQKYLADTPRFITYICSACSRYRELKPLLHLIEAVEGIAPSNILAYNKPPAK